MTLTLEQMQFPPRPRAYQAIALLMLAALVSFLDRQLLTLLVTPIKQDLHVTDTQIGLLQGGAFALFFSVMAMPFGWLVDRANRRNLVAAGIALWSLATIASGLAHSFGALLAARVAVGVGEASLMPAAYSLLADYFPPRQRGRAFGVFTLSVFAGGGGALLLGGTVLRALGNVTTVNLGVLGVHKVWQTAFFAAGAPGLLVALLVLTMQEPARQGVALIAERLDSFLTYLRANATAFVPVWAAYTLLAFVAFGLLPWIPTLFTRKFGLAIGQAGMIVGVLQMVGGIAGCLIAGGLGDRWTRAAKPGAKLRLMVIWWIVAAPTVIVLTMTSSLPVAIAALAVFSLVNTIGYASGSAVIQDMVPGHLRGRTTAFYYLVTGILGNGLGPMATGLVTDHVYHSEAALPYSMLTVALPGIALGLAATLLGFRAYDAVRAQLA